MTDWPEPDMPGVYIPPPLPTHPDPFSERGAEPRTWDDSAFDDERVLADLEQLGIYISYGDDSGLYYFAADVPRAERELGRLLGPDVPATCLGATREGLHPVPFGSWLSDGLNLHLFYALRLNGESPGGCVIVERGDCVLASLMIIDWLGAKTLVGGFRASHVTIALTTEVGQRAVIDCSENRARPHWRTAAAVNPTWVTPADFPLPSPPAR